MASAVSRRFRSWPVPGPAAFNPLLQVTATIAITMSMNRAAPAARFASPVATATSSPGRCSEGAALYFKGETFAIIGDDTFFIKVTEAEDALAGRARKEPPYPGAKPACRISAAKLDDSAWLTELVEVTADALATPSPKRR